MKIIEFLQNKMSMTEVYQPVIIKELICSGGSATKEELARKLAEYDLSVVEYYKRILMRWPKITLTKHDIVSYEQKGQFFRLTMMPESQADRDEAIRICEANIEKWLARKQDSERSAFGTASVRYQVLKQAHGKCQLCGMPAALRPIDIDHIVPRSKADKNGSVIKDGKLIDVNAPENLQALCFECNRAKRDSDQTDFRRRRKLVRDRVPAIIEKEGRHPLIRRLHGQPFKKALAEKLLEEHSEFLAASTADERVAELADLIEVAFTIAREEGYSWDKMMDLIAKKRKTDGAFENGLFYEGDE